MKKLFFIIGILFLQAAAIAQPFEGKIIYENKYKSKLPNVTDEQLTAMMGSKQDYFVKAGNYKIATNGSYFQWQIYVNKDNKLYNKMTSSESLYWIDAAANPDAVIKAEIKKGVIDILGYTCDEITLTCKSGVQKYYYSPKLKADAKLFTNFKYQNFYEYISRTQALPLKMIIETPQFSLESVATEVKPTTLDAKLFAIPADAKLEKSPF
jgi:hypothetical protein